MKTETENINTVGWPAELMQNHVYECHEAIRDLKAQAETQADALAGMFKIWDELELPDTMHIAGLARRVDCYRSALDEPAIDPSFAATPPKNSTP